MPLRADINNKVSPVPFNTQQNTEIHITGLILIDSELYN